MPLDPYYTDAFQKALNNPAQSQYPVQSQAPLPPPSANSPPQQSEVDRWRNLSNGDVDRWRQMGTAGPQGATVNTGQSDASRAYQMQGMGQMQGAMSQTQGAVNLARQAATGSAPSAAEIYGGKMIDDSINSQMAMANSARGGPAAVAAAQRQAAFQGAQTQQGGARDLAAMRANEMAQGREQYLGATGQLAGEANAYTGAAGSVRGQDYQQAYGQAGFDDAAQARQQQNQQYYEGLGQNARMGSMNGALQHESNVSNDYQGRRDLTIKDEQNAWGKVKDIAGGIGGAIGSFFSDERTKQEIAPVPTAGGGAPPLPVGIRFLQGENVMANRGPGGAYMPQSAPSPMGTGFEALGQGLGRTGRSLYQVATNSGGGHGVGGGAELGPGGGITHGDLLRAGSGMGDPSMMHGMVGGGGITGGSSMGGHAIPGGEGGGAGLVSDERAKNIYVVESDPMANANRAQAGSIYTYKPGFDAASGQRPGEENVGPMAQNMAADPLASTAVKHGPGGLLMLDAAKLQKLQSAGIASLQNQVDQLKSGGREVYATGGR